MLSDLNYSWAWASFILFTSKSMDIALYPRVRPSPESMDYAGLMFKTDQISLIDLFLNCKRFGYISNQVAVAKHGPRRFFPALQTYNPKFPNTSAFSRLSAFSMGIRSQLTVRKWSSFH